MLRRRVATNPTIRSSAARWWSYFEQVGPCGWWWRSWGRVAATVHRWKAQDLIDRGVKPGLSTSEHGELAAARRRIKELVTELALVKQAAALFEEGVRPKTSTR
jgi:hypothetical protein